MGRTKKVKDPDRRVGFGKVTLWQTSSVSVAVNTLIMGYVTIYCTDTLGLNAAIVGTIFMVSKLVDGVTDMLAGIIIDRTQTRWGKGRPYEIFMLGLWTCTWLMFSTPDSWSAVLKYVWLFIMYTLVNAVCKTFLNGNNLVYLIRAFKTKDQQVKVTAYGSFYTMVAGFLFNMLFPAAMAKIATSPAGWSRLVGMIALPLTALGVLRMLTIPEKYNNETDADEQTVHLKVSDVALLFKNNRNFVVFILVTLIFNIIANMGVAVYYWTWIVGNVALMGVTSVFTILGLPLAFIMPRWIRKYGITKMSAAGFFVELVGYVIIFFARENLVPLVIGILLTSLGAVPFTLVGGLVFINLADYNEYINKPRMEASMSAINGLMSKIGSALGGFILGILLSAAGYDGTLTQQPGSALFMIRMLWSVVPAIFMVVLIVMLLKAYNLDSKMPEIKAELDRRKAEREAKAAAEKAQ